MGQPIDTHLLCQSWLHSRHEDTGTDEVYRPAEFAFPRRERGRAGYQFNADGTFKRIGIGATDVSEVTAGVWHIDHAKANQIRTVVNGEPHLLEITDLTPDRLVIRHSPSPYDS